MNGFDPRYLKRRRNERPRRGATGFAPFIIVAAILAGVAIAVVVAVRAAAPGQEPANGANSAAPENPLRSPGSQNPPAGRPPSEGWGKNSPPGTAAGQPQPSATRRSPAVSSTSPAAPNTAAATATPGRHPLDAAIGMAEKVLAHLQKDVKDYTCVIVKQERLDGNLGEPQFMAAKIRQQPFSVFLDFLKPDDIRGREVLYVAGANDGDLLVRNGSGWTRSLGMLKLPPTGPIAMHDNRYPITDLGLMPLTQRLLEIARRDRGFGEIEVHFFKNAKVNTRVCTLIEVVHPIERRTFLFHKAQIYIDDELNVPIRYAAYMWPKKSGDEPPLDEAYTYLNLKLNVGLTDADFDPHNPKYHFFDK